MLDIYSPVVTTAWVFLFTTITMMCDIEQNAGIRIYYSGAMYRVDDLPEDCEAPSPRPDWIDEAIFK